MILAYLTPVQPHDGIQIFQLPLAPLVQGAIHYGIVIPGIDEQHMILDGFCLTLIEEPDRTGQRFGVEKVVAHAHHHIHMAGLHQFLPDVPILTGTVGGRRCHNESRPALLIQVGIEIGDPQVVGIAEFLDGIDGR